MSARSFAAASAVVLLGAVLAGCGQGTTAPTERTGAQRSALSTDGLVAAYGFDEGSGDAVHDATGAGQDAELSGQHWVVGKFGSALEFENAFLDVAASPALDLTNAMTLTAWVLPKAGEQAAAMVLAKEYEWDASYQLSAETWWGGPQFDLNGSGWTSASSSSRLPVTRWSHLAATYDGASMKLYVDGALADETELAESPQVVDTPLRIGGMTWERFFHGRIDEVRIYNRALSASEIAEVMAEPVTTGATADVTAPSVAMTAPVAGAVSGQVGLAAEASDGSGVGSVQFLVDDQPYGYPVQAPPYEWSWHSRAATAGSHELRARATDFSGNATVSAPVVVTVDAAETTPGLVAAFGFDEGSGEDVHDVTGAGHDTVLSGQVWVGGKYGSALEFDESFLEVAGSSLLDLTNAMTVSAWVLPKNQLEDATILAKEKVWESSFELYAATPRGGPEWNLHGASWGNAATQRLLPTTSWSHVAGTYDGATIKLYVDGVLADETASEDGAYVTDTPLRIGGTTWERFFHGRIDEVRIYNRALSGSEIADVMTQPVTAGATADAIAPSVAMTAPVAGAVSGQVALAAEASDGGGVASVQFLVDGQPYGYALHAPPYQLSWHSRAATAGSHELRARATDFAGNATVSAPVEVTVDAAETTPGLVAAFGFDEGSGEDVHDATGAGHDAVLSGQSWIAGKYGSALEFDEGFLEVGRSSLLDLTTDMTLAAWVLPKPGEPSEAPILAKEDMWRGSYLLNASTYYTGPQLNLLRATWGDFEVIETPSRLPVTEWSHVAATYEQNQAKIYVNGVLVADGPIEGPIEVTDTPLRIGGTWSWYSYFHGRIDEVRIYNRALSGGEIAQVMTQPVTAGATGDETGPSVALTAPAAGAVSGQVGMVAEASDASGVARVQFLVDGQPYGYAVQAPPYQLNWHSRAATAGNHELQARATDYAGNVSVSAPVVVTVDAGSTTPGLVAAFAFDEGSGEDVHDVTGAGHDTVLDGQTWVAGKYGSALEFDEGYLEVERSSLLDLTTGMTLAAWVLPQSGEPADLPIIAKEDMWRGTFLLNANAYHAGPQLDLLRGPWGDFERIETYTRLPATEWSHVAATYEENQAKIYVNGVLAAEGPFDGPLRVTDTPLRIGGTWSWYSFFHGRIDEVRIYDRALSGAELAEVMTQPLTAGATADTTGPTVAMTAPVAGAVSGQVGMMADASDAGGVASVQFEVDGQPYGYVMHAPPYQLSWHSRAATAGSHDLRVRATDFAGNTSVSAPVVVTVEAANTTPGLVAAFSFDEGSGEDVHDATGAGHDTVRSGQAWVAGRFGNALDFEDGYLEVEGSYLLDLTTAMTVSVWVLPKEGYPANQALIAKEHEYEQSYVLSSGNWAGRPEWALHGSDEWGTIWAPNELAATKWTHLAGTYDGQHVRLYVDGELANEVELEGGARVTDTPLRIGGMTWGNEFRGRIDEVRIYNRALSAAEIAGVMTQPVTPGAVADTTAPTVALTSPAPGTVSGNVLLTAEATDDSGVRQVELVVDGVALGAPLTSPPFEKHWHATSATPGTHELRARATDRAGNVGLSAPVTVVVEDTGAVPGLVAAFGFDEGSGEAVHDETGAGHDTVLDGQSWETGKYGGALAFDGNYLTIADSDLLDLTTGMTLSAWVRPTSPLPTWPTVVMKEWDYGLLYSLYAGSGDDGAPSVWYRPSMEGGEVGASGGSRLELGLWTHLAATFDGAHLRMYVNGEPTVDVPSEASIATTTNPLRIGGNSIWNGEWFYGLIDEVRIYNRALSQVEIGADMARPVSEGAAPDTTAPQVALTAPVAGSTVFGNVTLRAQASDAYGIESVQFFVDGVAFGDPLGVAPFETSWSTSSSGAGSHTLKALAFDRSGNSAFSASVVVTVSDTPPACDPQTVSDGNPCTSDSCDAAGQPLFTPLAAGTSCSDGDRCNGVEACNGAGACWPGTPPSTDATCDGVDDDCNGEIDEDFVGASTSCGVGACARTATPVCENGSPTGACTPGTPASSDATCNGVDDDCDGSIDEDYVAVATSCGVGSCAANGTSSCVNGAVVSGCVPGLPAASDASCNGVDNDCDGSIDEDFVPVATTCGASSCARTGATSCSNGAVADSCTPGTPAANDATCDGIDNDCDGSVDEDFAPAATSCGVGACAATGTTSCVGGVLGDSCRAGVAAATDASCNGVDDDCNGQRDEDFVSAATSCGLGACAAVGTTSCVNGAVQDSCAQGTAATSDDTCNGIDDDCDGSVDEAYVAPETHCGGGACSAVGHERCVAGQLVDDCQAGSGATQDSSCNGVDDDCDGSIDEDYVATPTSCGTGACARTGNLRCQGAQVVNDCTAGNPAASDATCNGIDDDCNGSVDEDYLSAPTTCTVGACQATGETHCVGGTEEDSCTPGTTSAADETCDGLDNDCDGTADEGYVAHGTTCGVGACARTGNTSCVSGHESDSCQAGSAASSDASCNGVDDDCDGSKDEDYVATATTCGVGACAATGQIRCQGGAVVTDCTAGNPTSDANCNGVDDDCDGSVDEDYVPTPTSCGVGACAATGMSRCEAAHVVSGCTAGTPATLDASCDGIDNDCDGVVDEDYLPEPVSCGVGACARNGQTRCQSGSVTPDCTPGNAAASDASCNGVDDDCNGSVDEDYVVRATSCGVGSCTNSGTTACQAGQEVDSCRPLTGSASDTVCNGIDDDCDGSKDEDFVPQTLHCGVGVCAATGSSRCENGAVVQSCTPGNPTSDDSECNAVDDDCDGSIDEAYVGVSISCGQGACHATGVMTCEAGVESPQCTPGAPADDDSNCNGVDDDCDGPVDEEFVEVATQCGQGACASTGHTACAGGHVSNTCAPAQPAVTVDDSCNGVDDDCDGPVDDEYVGHATTCGVGACAATGNSSCVAGAEQPNCSPKAAALDDSSCNGVDDDCDNSVDEDYAGTPTSCGIGACHATGNTTCSGGHVGDTCHAGTPAVGDATCDGIDDDCDNSVDEDYLPPATACGVGVCRTTGSITCQAGHTSDTCTPLPKTGTDDDCDGQDDDCDGQADEAYVPHCAGTAIESCSSGALQTQQCQDADACNGTESCSAGHCVAGTPIPSNDGNPCTADACEPSGVTHTPLALGSSCGTSKVCDGQGTCIGKPEITTQPSAVTVSPGADAAFGVTATGALLSYQWRRTGQPIAGATSPTLVLPQVQLADSGTELSVAVSNPAGTVVSSGVTLTVSDTAGPVLIVDGAAQRSVTTNTLLITGSALDDGQPAASLVASSSRFPGEVAGIIDPGSGAFRIEVPVSPGANTITITAKDGAGNATQKSVVATLELARLPSITLTEPQNGLETDAEKLNVKGYVRSSLPPEQIRLVLGSTVLFPTGSGGEYSFSFDDVRLNFGSNLLSVRAETRDGTVTAMAAVLRREPGTVSEDAPVVSVIGGSSLQFVKESSLPIKGTVSAKRCTSSVTVNGSPATLTGAGSSISFAYTLPLPSGDEEVPVEVVAADCDGRVGRLNYRVIHDDVAPVIEVALAPSPAVHNVSTTPYLIVGKISESHLATVTSNQQSLGVLPGSPGSYDFSFAVPLTRGLDDVVTVEAVDQAGNIGKYSLTLHLDAVVDIEVIAPVAGSEIQTLKDPFDVDVVARAIGLPADFTGVVRLDGGGIYPLTRADSTFKATLSLRGTTGTHTATIAILNDSGTSVADKSVSFKVTDANSIPLVASLKAPVNGSSNVEANEPVVVELNRPVADPKKIKIELVETVHGKRYKPYALGASVAEFTNVQLEDVSRDQAAVPGGMSFLPGDRLYAFYPARDYGYGGTVSVRVLNDGVELTRGQFNVRPLPTLASGFVADQFSNSIAGLDVRLDDIQVTTQSNTEGVFSLGFGKADAAIPGGRHKLILNPGLKNRAYGVIEQWVNLQEGRLTDLGVQSVPLLDPAEPFRRISGGSANVLLRGGDLELDLSQASLLFPDGTTAGDVHTNVFLGASVGYPALAVGMPMLSFGLQPMGIQVSGPFGVSFALPPLGDNSYIDGLPELVMLIGLDPDALLLVPIGVGRVDKQLRRVTSARPLQARRLDFIAMVPLSGSSFQSLFSKFAAGQVSLETLTMAVEKTR